MKSRLMTVVFLAGAAGLLYFMAGGRPPAPAAPKKGEKLSPAPNFTLPDLKGRPVSLSDFKGKVVLLDFWATWCGPCVEEMPDLIALHEKNKAAGFSMVGVSVDEDKDAVAPFVKEQKIPYPILWAGTKIPEGYSIPGTPTAFLITADGLIAKTYYGAKPYNEVVKDVSALLGPASTGNLVK